MHVGFMGACYDKGGDRGMCVSRSRVWVGVVALNLVALCDCLQIVALRTWGGREDCWDGG